MGFGQNLENQFLRTADVHLDEFAGDPKQCRQHHGSIDHQFVSPGQSSFQHRLTHVDAALVASVSATVNALNERGGVELEHTLAFCFSADAVGLQCQQLRLQLRVTSENLLHMHAHHFLFLHALSLKLLFHPALLGDLPHTGNLVHKPVAHDETTHDLLQRHRAVAGLAVADLFQGAFVLRRADENTGLSDHVLTLFANLVNGDFLAVAGGIHRSELLVIDFSVHLHQQGIAIRDGIIPNIARNGHRHVFVTFDEEIVGHAHSVTGFANADSFKQARVFELIERQVGVELVGHLFCVGLDAANEVRHGGPQRGHQRV
mmetsp:Transcript_22580/g.38988  ORF Transcript_22580/g.38988 Transcript_22580/m.38988 type:complete len:317 (+) Transcript_22580:625-1575(+)